MDYSSDENDENKDPDFDGYYPGYRFQKRLLTNLQHKVINDYYQYFEDSLDFESLLKRLWEMGAIEPYNLRYFKMPDRSGRKVASFFLIFLKNSKNFETFYNALRTSSEANGALSKLLEPAMKKPLSSLPIQSTIAPDSATNVRLGMRR